MVSSPGREAFWQHENGVPIAPREATLGRRWPGQPLPVPVFGWRGHDVRSARQLQAEYMFDVVRDARRVAVPPLGKDFEGIGHLPVRKLAGRSVDAGFFKDFAAGCFNQRFAVLAATRHRLPESRVGCSFQQEYVKGSGVYDDQHGNRLFVTGGHTSARVEMPRAGASISTQKGTCVLRLSSAAVCKTVIKVAKSTGCVARKRVMPLMNRT